ncbi:hypothetical protein L4D09_17580 [Photobacterium makurazakiensis]|uniref:hypothetical protein n=1 Tax=Photobacterium makurazakiensis TaxID=2910234 RepID=UPI003D10B365
MKTVAAMIKKMSVNTRRQWVARLVVDFSTDYQSAWQALGYQSKQDFEHDLAISKKYHLRTYL